MITKITLALLAVVTIDSCHVSNKSKIKYRGAIKVQDKGSLDGGSIELMVDGKIIKPMNKNSSFEVLIPKDYIPGTMSIRYENDEKYEDSTFIIALPKDCRDCILKIYPVLKLHKYIDKNIEKTKIILKDAAKIIDSAKNNAINHGDRNVRRIFEEWKKDPEKMLDRLSKILDALENSEHGPTEAIIVRPDYDSILNGLYDESKLIVQQSIDFFESLNLPELATWETELSGDSFWESNEFLFNELNDTTEIRKILDTISKVTINNTVQDEFSITIKSSADKNITIPRVEAYNNAKRILGLDPDVKTEDRDERGRDIPNSQLSLLRAFSIYERIRRVVPVNGSVKLIFTIENYGSALQHEKIGDENDAKYRYAKTSFYKVVKK